MSKITLKDVIKAGEVAKEQLAKFGYKAPQEVSYKINGRMKNALGQCRQRAMYGVIVEVSIHINKDLPLEYLQGVMIHEYIHAVMPLSEHHGALFQKAARQVNKAYGYKVSTYAQEEEVVALRSIQASTAGAGAFISIRCKKCGKEHLVSSRRKVAKYPGQFSHNGCGGRFELVNS